MGKPPVRFQRANFVVRNLDRALEFYIEVLGFTLDFVKNSEASSYSYTVFEIPTSAAIRFAVLSAPDQPRVMALTEVTGPGIGAVAHPRRAAIVLEIPDLDALLKRARDRGFTVCSEGVLVTFDGRQGREVGLVDADDNLTVAYCLPEQT